MLFHKNSRQEYMSPYLTLKRHVIVLIPTYRVIGREVDNVNFQSVV